MPECAAIRDVSSSTGDSTDSRSPTSDATAQGDVVRGQGSTRPASAPLPQVSDRRDVNDVSDIAFISAFWTKSLTFQSRCKTFTTFCSYLQTGWTMFKRCKAPLY